MASGYTVGNKATEFNSVYQITQDMSNWDKSTIQVVAPVTGSLYVYGSNDGNFVNGVQQGDASLAINFSPIQVVNLATGAATNTITAAGLYQATVNSQYLRVYGNPITGSTIANVYKILLFNSKV